MFYLAKIIKSKGIDNMKSVMDALEKVIIDVELREKLTVETKKFFASMSEPIFKKHNMNEEKEWQQEIC